MICVYIGIVNIILSWNGFIPLSRLTYAAYLIHPVAMMVYVYSKKSLVYISDFDMVSIGDVIDFDMVSR
jgi:hypothetical protein